MITSEHAQEIIIDEEVDMEAETKKMEMGEKIAKTEEVLDEEITIEKDSTAGEEVAISTEEGVTTDGGFVGGRVNMDGRFVNTEKNIINKEVITDRESTMAEDTVNKKTAVDQEVVNEVTINSGVFIDEVAIAASARIDEKNILDEILMGEVYMEDVFNGRFIMGVQICVDGRVNIGEGAANAEVAMDEEFVADEEDTNEKTTVRREIFYEKELTMDEDTISGDEGFAIREELIMDEENADGKISQEMMDRFFASDTEKLDINEEVVDEEVADEEVVDEDITPDEDAMINLLYQDKGLVNEEDVSDEQLTLCGKFIKDEELIMGEEVFIDEKIAMNEEVPIDEEYPSESRRYRKLQVYQPVAVVVRVTCLNGFWKGVTHFHLFLPDPKPMLKGWFDEKQFLEKERRPGRSGIVRVADYTLVGEYTFMDDTMLTLLIAAKEAVNQWYDEGMVGAKGWTDFKSEFNGKTVNRKITLKQLIATFLETNPEPGMPLVLSPISKKRMINQLLPKSLSLPWSKDSKGISS